MIHKIVNTAGLDLFITKKKLSYHILTPARRHLEKGFVVVFTEIVFDWEIDPLQNRSADYWSLDGEKFFLTAGALEKISNIARVFFTDSKLVEREVDESKRATFIKQQIYYEYLRPDGFLHKSTTSGEYNYHEDCLRIVYPDDVYDGDKLVAKKGEPNTKLINLRRRSAGMIAESSAKHHALMEVFPVLKKPLNLVELHKPFLVGTINPDREQILEAHPHLQDSYYLGLLDISDKMYSR